MSKDTLHFYNNIAVRGIVANGSTGTAGEALVSNGSGAYWGTVVGFTGSKGEPGDFGGASFQYKWSSNTEILIVANGFIEINNTNPALANTLSISILDSNSIDITTFIQTIDDSTSSIKGVVRLSEQTNSANFIVFNITGEHSNNTNHYYVPIAYVAGTQTPFANNTDIIASFTVTGNRGDAGFTGSRGDTGATGFTGSIGFTGSQGPQGTTGFTGSQGIQGVIGFTGSQGAQGPIGFTGSQSTVAGPQGLQGPIGFTGSRGDQGQTGFVGSQGSAGFTGSIGFTGSQGIGFTGSQGTSGPTGPTGPQGVIGFTGSQGPQGTTGFTGSQGIQGVTGFTGSIGFTGSQGPQGPIGFTGSQGAQGPIGFTGSQGAQGPSGAQGAIGFTGSLGFTGSQGAVGPTGFTGSTGASGASGFTGSQGVTGFTGSTGPIGGANTQVVFNDSGTANGSSNFVFNKTTGDVGIGTTSPGVKLTANGVTAVGVGSKLSFIGLDINSGVTPGYIKIRTTIPAASASADFTVNIKGFRYGGAEMCDLTIGWHWYTDTFFNPSVSSSGSFAPTVRLSNEGGFVCIVLTAPGYWPKLYVESMYSSEYDHDYASGWSWIDENASGSPIVTVPYKSNFGNGFAMDSAGVVSSTNSFRAPIFYDSNNTVYYTDPASTSVMNIIQFATNSAQIAANETSSYGSLVVRGSRNTWRGIHFEGGGNAPHLMFDGSANGGVYYETTGRWASYYSHGNNCWGFGASSTSSAYNIYCLTGIYSGGRVDGTIFYDSDNTAYYLDAANTTTSMVVAGNVGIGTSSPGAKLDVLTSTNSIVQQWQGAGTNFNLRLTSGNGASANTASYRIALDYLNGTHTNGFIDFYRGGDGATGYLTFGTSGTERMRISPTGIVGIGTTNPTVGRLQIAAPVGDWGQYIVGSNTTSQSYGMLIDAGTNSSDTAFRIRSYGGADYMHVRGDGNVGIGTTNPANFMLQVAGNIGPNANGGSNLGSVSTRFGTLYVNSIQGNGANAADSVYELAAGNILLDNNRALRFKDSAGAGFSALTVTTANNVQILTPADSGSLLLQVTSNTGVMQLFTNNAERMRIDASGNVGIGTTSPSAALHVKPSSSGATPNADARLIVESAGGTVLNLLSPNANYSAVYFGDATGGSNAGIVHRASSNGSYAASMAFFTDSAERLTILQSGNIGIGNTDPGAKLDISGDSIRIRTAQTPASNGTGVAGEIAWDDLYLYVCTATNIWKRIQLIGGY